MFFLPNRAPSSGLEDSWNDPEQAVEIITSVFVHRHNQSVFFDDSSAAKGNESRLREFSQIS
jgi:hypothetical protein